MKTIKTRKITALVLSLAISLSGCSYMVTDGSSTLESETSVAVEIETEEPEEAAAATEANVEDVEEADADQEDTDAVAISEESEDDISFSGLDDPDLLLYIEDNIYASIEAELASDDYEVESVTSTYVSKEYLEELAYNSRDNIYFGYSLSEIEEQFDGAKYIFTLGEDGSTVVQAYEEHVDGSFDDVLLDVAIGSGVILVCVTVSVISGGLGGTAVSTVFAASAKTGAIAALSSGGLGAVSAGIVTGYETGDFDEAVEAAAAAGSEAFKWGAIVGAISGGLSEAIALNRAATAVRTPRESELFVLEEYGGAEQVSYLNGVEVSYGTPGATRPDVVRTLEGHLEAIEVKNYNLESYSNRYTLYSELKRQVTARVENLPSGTTQRIVLDTQGRGFSAELVDDVVSNIRIVLQDIYPDIIIDVLG